MIIFGFAININLYQGGKQLIENQKVVCMKPYKDKRTVSQ